MDFNQLKRTIIDQQSLTLLESTQYVYHCHHYNLFHDQTLDDILGEKKATEIRTQVAHDAFYPLLMSACERLGAETEAERLQVAAGLLPWMGHGKLDLDVSEQGGSASGQHLHYGVSWREKYSEQIRRRHPVDSVAAGYAAAAVEIGLGLKCGTMAAEEHDCVAKRDSVCTFKVKPSLEENGKPRGLGIELPEVPNIITGIDEERIEEIARGLQSFVAGVSGDDRGLVQAFGVYVTAHLAAYYNDTVAAAIQHIEKNQPDFLPYAEELMREAGQVCAFFTYGNILLSPEWEALVGPLSSKPEDIISFSCAISRGLGFGRWTVQEFVPKEKLVLRVAANYEAPYFVAKYGTSDRPQCFLLQGGARALMLLATSIDLGSGEHPSEAMYRSFFSQGKLPWKVEEKHCLCCGDDYCEVVVTPA